ncbi:hypothetical protein [Acinetobacter sp. YH01026]|uniref:hypothetical protein n=1 Tax=Acinetobacter sp. YH01026 TaxID=2601039 RepID=UPI0015D3784E|nr:hypothetical protein [Acinetobacter sp. YH01026]
MMKYSKHLLIKKNTFNFFIMAFALVLLSIIYFLFFTTSFFSNNLFNLSAINWHDHEIYVYYIDLVSNSDWSLEINNNTGIAIIYFLLSFISPSFLLDENYLYLSLITNILVLILIFFLYNRFCDKFNLPSRAKYFLFWYFPLIYFCQLINKDIFTILAFLFILNFSIVRPKFYSIFLILILVPFLMLIRLQLVVFALIFLILLYSKHFKLNLFFIYCMTSISAAWLSIHGGYIEEETFGSGMTAFLRSWNLNYSYTGFLIFNPIRVFQYLQAMYMSFIFIDEGRLDWARLLNIPSILILSFYWRYIVKVFLNLRFYLKTNLRPLIILVISFLITWLMNPTVNIRYVMLVVPFLILLGVAVKHRKLGKEN